MTVSTITNVASQVARNQENQNRQADSRVKQPGGATLPTDSVTLTAPAQSLVGNDTLRREIEAQNIEASQSTLRDDDLPDVDGTAQERIQAQATAALKAQTSKLPPNLLALLSE